MAIIPCSMSTVGKMAAGIGDTLITRAASVCLKERRRLVVVPRETPLSVIHLRSLTTLAEAGAIIMPAMPAFYTKPETVDDMVDFIAGRVMEVLGAGEGSYRHWEG
jgi:4-hydroxy-3-polyprenylbenzoate decarboxylase